MTSKSKNPICLLDFLSDALMALDAIGSLPNFHLKIVLELQQYLGCYPDFEQAHLPFFNLEEADFKSIIRVTRSGPVITDLSTLAKTFW